MSAAVTPTQESLYTVLRSFILGLLPCEVVQGISNGAPMPIGGFVTITELFRTRLSTNIYAFADPTPNTGTSSTTQAAQVTVQIDVYGPLSSDWAAILVTMLRSEYACDALAPVIQPLSADDPRMLPLINGEQQYEQRWSITALFQINTTVLTPLQFFDTARIGLREIGDAYLL